MRQRGEFKFRAWQPNYNQMTYWHNFNAPTFSDSEWPSVIYMQWTGLTDSNGKDIYEGDILHDTNSPGDEGYRKVVEWRLGPRGIGFNIGRRVGRRVVVGNIYENPERYV